MTIYEILGIIIIHWFADFVMQTDEEAKGKSENWGDLISHTYRYSLCWMFAIAIYGGYNMFVNHMPPSSFVGNAFAFSIITFVIHTVTDYYTSKAHKVLWDNKETHNFFVSIGFDQVLHYIQLFITYQFLFK